MIDSIVKVEDFRKAYGNFTAVDGISFEVRKGEIFGLLGPNGAGKTSTLECLEGLREPDGGLMEIVGLDAIKEARKLRNILGIQLQASSLPHSIKVKEAMDLFCAYHNVPLRNDLLDRFGLSDMHEKQYLELSTGQQRRLVLALAIAHNPQVLILDEPTAGLDVSTRVELHRIMKELKEKGTTIILATHDMAEAEKMADKIAILLKGKIAATGTPKEITAAGSGLTKVSVHSLESSLFKDEINFTGVSQREVKDEYIVYFSDNPAATVSEVIPYITSKNDTLVDLRVERPSLEERFLEIVKGGI